MSKMLFSIIIPHYDIPDLLMRCLKSIPVSEDIQVMEDCLLTDGLVKNRQRNIV